MLSSEFIAKHMVSWSLGEDNVAASGESCFVALHITASQDSL